MDVWFLTLSVSSLYYIFVIQSIRKKLIFSTGFSFCKEKVKRRNIKDDDIQAHLEF